MGKSVLLNSLHSRRDVELSSPINPAVPYELLNAMYKSAWKSLMNEPYFVSGDDIGWLYFEEAIGEVQRCDVTTSLVLGSIRCDQFWASFQQLLDPVLGKDYRCGVGRVTAESPDWKPNSYAP